MAEPIRVYVVDDHPVVREGIRRSLEPEPGVTVVGEAGSAEECFVNLDAGTVDVVMMDVRMAGMDGIEATRRLRFKHPDLKVIILSSFWDGYLIQAIKARASGYILKTATRRVLADALVQVAGGKFAIDPDLTEVLAGLARDEHVDLSPREREILRLISTGMPSKEIETTLSISRAAMGRDLRSSFDKLGVNDRAHAVAEALRRGLI